MSAEVHKEGKKAKKDKSERKEKKEAKKRKREKELEKSAISIENKHKKPKITEDSIADSKLSKKQRKLVQSTPSIRLDDLLRKRSPFVQRTLSLHVTLSPCANHFPLEGICAEHISPLLLTYHPHLDGVLLSYSNPRLSDKPESGSQASTVYAKSIDEYGVTFVWVTADFTIFQPKQGTYLEGYVNLQTENLLGLMCYNYFNAAIERSQLPSEWAWVESKSTEIKEAETKKVSGHFVDGTGKAIEGRLVFKVRDFDVVPNTDNTGTGGSMLHTYGTLLSLADGSGPGD